MPQKRYIAKPDGWFDAGTEVEIEFIMHEDGYCGKGYVNGEIDEETGLLDEFFVIENEDCDGGCGKCCRCFKLLYGVDVKLND